MISFPWFYAAFIVLQCCVAAGTARRPELGASNSLHLESPTQPQLAIRPPCRPLDFGLRGECCREIEEAPPFGGASFLARDSPARDSLSTCLPCRRRRVRPAPELP